MEDMNFEYEKQSNTPVETEELVSDLKRLAEETDKVLQSDYAKKGRYDCSTIIRRFGIWNKVLKKLESDWQMTLIYRTKYPSVVLHVDQVKV